MAQTAACIDIFAKNTVTLSDAFQFDPNGSWSLVGQAFKMEVKASPDDAVALVTWASSGGTIVVDDVVNRVIHLNVSEAALQAALPVGEYVYDLVMFDTSSPPIRVLLMQGRFCLSQGVTES